MITLTERAAVHIKKLLTTDSLGIHISIKKTGCAGFGYVVEIAERATALRSHQFTSHDVNIYVNESDMGHLDGTIIDFEKKGLNEEFVYTNPHATGSCGCNKSFTVS